LVEFLAELDRLRLAELKYTSLVFCLCRMT